MGVMKTLAIAMEDDVLDDPQSEECRREGWSDALLGVYRPENYVGEAKRAYRLGCTQYEEALLETKR